MGYNPDIHNRRSIRLKGFDYTSAGYYFVTICVEQREYLFSQIINGISRLNDAGRMVEQAWHELPSFYPGVQVDAFVVMPNHIHGIIVLQPPVGAGPRACPPSVLDTASSERNPGPGQARGPAPTMSLCDVVQRFKSFTTTRYGQGVSQEGWPPYAGHLWQRNYFERIIRTEDELASLRTYIEVNPARWETDELNAARR